MTNIKRLIFFTENFKRKGIENVIVSPQNSSNFDNLLIFVPVNHILKTNHKDTLLLQNKEGKFIRFIVPGKTN